MKISVFINDNRDKEINSTNIKVKYQTYDTQIFYFIFTKIIIIEELSI